MKEKLKSGLWEELHPYLNSPECDQILARMKRDVREGRVVYPSSLDIFNAYKLVSPDDVKVVILGQDPYHNGSATGLAFGVNKTPVPVSLRNIFKELCDEFDHRVSMDDFDFSLNHWGRQGVFLLNTSLTVKKGQPGSYLGMWDFLVIPTLRLIKYRSPNAIYFLWGNYAQRYKEHVGDRVLFAAHPAAESYKSNAGFFGCGHFYHANQMLDRKIDWFKG